MLSLTNLARRVGRMFGALPSGFPDEWQLLPALTVDALGWLQGEGVTHVPMHASWFGGTLVAGRPGGIVAHCSATNAGTALSMARRRAQPFAEWKAAYEKAHPGKRAHVSSWHASVEADGSLLQMAPLSRVTHHAGGPSSKQIPGLGWANGRTVGIELIGWERGPWPDVQMVGAARLWRAIAQRYDIPRRFAMIEHRTIDPTRRSDPGREFMRKHAHEVLDYACPENTKS